MRLAPFAPYTYIHFVNKYVYQYVQTDSQETGNPRWQSNLPTTPEQNHPTPAFSGWTAARKLLSENRTNLSQVFFCSLVDTRRVLVFLLSSATGFRGKSRGSG
jgi:hypothetical protein